MQRFMQEKNLTLFLRRLLAEQKDMDEERRQVISKLVAEEEAKSGTTDQPYPVQYRVDDRQAGTARMSNIAHPRCAALDQDARQAIFSFMTMEVDMQRFVHHENIALYKKLMSESALDPSRDEDRHKMLLRLFAEEKAKDVRNPLDS